MNPPLLIRHILLFPLLLLLLSSCQTPQAVEEYTESEIDLARQGVREIAILSARNAVSSLPSHIETLSEEDLLDEELLRVITQYRDTAGVEKRMDGLLQALRYSLTRFVLENYEEVDSLIVLGELNDPYALIQGDSDAVTRMLSTRFFPVVSDSVTEHLSSDEQVARATESLFSILNSIRRIDAFRDGRPSPQPIDEISYSRAINSILERLAQEMGKEEGIIRSLAIDYESPAIRVFAL